MTYETIYVSRDERGIASVKLARPEKHNAMNAEMIAELSRAAEQLAGDATIRAVILSGEGPTFCAGGDLGWMRAQAEQDREGKLREAGALARMLGLWNALPKPLIGRVHGAAYGGGIGIIAACDVVVAEVGTRFALTETRLGLIPATIGPFVVGKLGEAFTRQVFFTARPFDAEFLQRAGMVTRICPAAMLDQAIEEEIAFILDCAPGAVTTAKKLCADLIGMDPAARAEFTANALADRWETEETGQGIAAFFARETPPWKVNQKDKAK